jgi:phosphate transport system permease protein
MSVRASLNPAAAARARVQIEGSKGDRIMWLLTVLAALAVMLTLVDVIYQVIHGAVPAINEYGLHFLTASPWSPPLKKFGALPMLYGTGVTSAIALVIATPVSLAIALYLSMLAPKWVRTVVGPLVEMLAAIPSVILGFWGLLILSPFVHEHIEPFLHNTLGFIPIFGEPQATGASVFTASLILTIMIIPIIASISRDLFLSVPREVQDGASALGATRWEVVRGVVLPNTASGVMAASLLGLGRALGEAIAVAQVIGAGSEIHTSLFKTGDTLAARIANQFPGAITELQKASLYYLGVILLVIGLVSNLAAQWIGRRFDVRRGAAK